MNPLQFGPTEDLSKYPRTLERDAAMLEQLGVDLLFTPTTEEMYPPGAKSYVVVEGLSDKLDGASRPGHFRGVATVVTKLFEIVRPDCAFFGQKDAVQVVVLRKLVNDLDLDVEMVVCPYRARERWPGDEFAQRLSHAGAAATGAGAASGAAASADGGRSRRTLC